LRSHGYEGILPIEREKVLGEREIILRVEGVEEDQGSVPLHLLASKLEALQRLVLSVGSARAGGRRRGTWKAAVARACELYFVSAEPGSTLVRARVAEPQAALFDEEDLGLEALTLSMQTIEAASAQDEQRVFSYFPDRGARARVLVAATELLPSEDSEYRLSLSTPKCQVQLPPELRPTLLRLARADEEETEYGPAVITGPLYLIQVQSGPLQVGVIWNNRQIICHYPSELEPLVRDFLPGSLVEVEGRASYTESGEISQIDSLYDMRPVEIEPLVWRSVYWAGRQFMLREPIQVNAEYRDGIWFHEYAPLKLSAYGESRRESLDAFKEVFSHAYDQLASEEDSLLTGDALAVKGQFNRLVLQVKQ